MSYQQFKNESEIITTLYEVDKLEDLSFTSLRSLCQDYQNLVKEMLEYIKTTTKETNVSNEKEIEQKMLSQVRGVFKYRTKSNSKAYSCYTSKKYDLVQVGYLDLEDSIVFNPIIQRPVSEPSPYSITRYLPGFHVRQYRNWEEYIPELDSNKEIKEVISSEIVEYSSGNYSSKKEIYSVVGFLNNENQFIHYDQIIEDEN